MSDPVGTRKDPRDSSETVRFWPGEYIVMSKEDWEAIEGVLDRAAQAWGPLDLKVKQTSLSIPSGVPLIAKFQAEYGGTGLIATQFGDDGEIIAHVEREVGNIPDRFEGRRVRVVMSPAPPTEIKRYWISWQEPLDEAEDYRPLKWPLPEIIPAYWCSGYGDDVALLCAIVDARSEAEAMNIVGQYWRPSEWRFVKERSPEWRPALDRFPWPEDAGD